MNTAEAARPPLDQPLEQLPEQPSKPPDSRSPRPPHYAVGQTRPRANNTATAVFAAGLTLISLLALIETCFLAPRAYAPATWSGLAVLALIGGCLCGLRNNHPERASAASWAGFAIAAAAAGYVWSWSFERAQVFAVCSWLWPMLLASGWGFASTLSVRAFLPALREHGVLSDLFKPVSVTLILAVWLGALLLLPGLGILRRSVALGAALSGLSLFAARLSSALEIGPIQPSPSRALLLWSSPLICAAALAGAEARVPLETLRRYSPDVLYALRTPYSEHVFVRLQGGLLMFSDGVLGFAGSDASRFAEALVHPALALSARRASVLAVVDGTGLVEREILRWPEVRLLTRLSLDPELTRFAESSAAFRRVHAVESANSLSDRLRSIEQEPSRFLLTTGEQFDTIIADFGDPTDYEAGKYYSVGLLRHLRSRLAPGGLLALQITSERRTPRAQSSILKSLEVAGFTTVAYRAPLPVLGEWGFVLAAPAEQTPPSPGLAQNWLAARTAALPDGTQFVTAGTLRSLFAASQELPEPQAKANYLYAQPAVELYLQEERSGLEAPEAQPDTE